MGRGTLREVRGWSSDPRGGLGRVKGPSGVQDRLGRCKTGKGILREGSGRVGGPSERSLTGG